MKSLLLLVVLMGCAIPIPLREVSIYNNTDNRRTGVWVVETGHQWIWTVTTIDEVRVHCGSRYAGCVIWEVGSMIGNIWLIDSNRIAGHECAHALGFSYAMTEGQIEAELNHANGNPAYIMLFGDGPARFEPCGASTRSTGELPGRLMVVEESENQNANR